MRFTGRPDIKSPDHKPPFRGLSRSEANKYSGCLAVSFLRKLTISTFAAAPERLFCGETVSAAALPQG